jgi:hypothetical protein
MDDFIVRLRQNANVIGTVDREKLDERKFPRYASSRPIRTGITLSFVP